MKETLLQLVRWELAEDGSTIDIADGRVPAKGDHVEFTIVGERARCVVERVDWSVSSDHRTMTRHSVAVVALKRV